MIAVDTNMIACTVFQTPRSKQVKRLSEAEPSWHVPTLWSSGFMNVAALYLRKGAIYFVKMIDISHQAYEIVGGSERRVAPANVIESVRRSGCSACDCGFRALADCLKTTLLTHYRQVRRTFPNMAPAPANYLAQFS